MQLRVVINCCVNQYGLRNCPYVSWTGPVSDGDVISLKFNGEEVEQHILSTKEDDWQTRFQMNWELINEGMKQIVTVGITRWIENKKIKYATGELVTQISWMNDLKNIIGNRDFRNLIIPGSHNSASVEGSGFLDQAFSGLYACQSVPTFQMGLLGNRFWDLRIKLDAGYFYIVHGKCTIQKADKVFEDIKRLLAVSKDVFFIDVHELSKGFSTPEDYAKFFKYVESFFGNNLAIPSQVRTFNQADSRNKRIVFSMSDKNMYDIARTVPLWAYSQTEHFWADAVAFYDIARHMLNHMKLHVNSRDPKVLCLQTTKGVFSGVFTSLDQFAWLHSKMVVKFLTSVSGLNPNIVIADFVESSTLIETAIELNRNEADLQNRNIPDYPDGNCVIM